ncbi:hypothetical protein ASC80_13555 [Afipia sp. Root123D2]|uniref:DUF6101 family protein n=1 Tax=Afipia sp. Root123D2 TaxID=1736436 RepID=UPI0006FF186C|nr:DUF6101 family protein [Afipia sp. Root123D2]KQW21146.1 hypothetical protein ASC80_13555 [Afipia sp. Root123D2]
MRRQFGVGGVQPVGSSRDMRLDPHSLPISFQARDGRADGEMRHIQIDRERVVVRRAVRGMNMTVQIRIREFLGIARRATDEGEALVLTHRDPSLSVPLLVTSDNNEIDNVWSQWSDLLALPQIEDESDDAREPAQRRRRRNVIRMRRPKFLMRRKAGYRLGETSVHRDEREIIART